MTQNNPTAVDPDAQPGSGKEPANAPTKQNPLAMAPGLTKVDEAHFHTGAPGTAGYRFSGADVVRANDQGIPSYLGPSQGGVLKYDPNATPHQLWIEPPGP